MTKKILLGAGLIVVLAVIIFVVLALRHAPSKTTQFFGAGCPEGAVFTTTPIQSTDLISIVPLGNLNPPDHTIPTDHIYLQIKNNNEIDPSASKKVVSPGEMSITKISRSKAVKKGEIFTDDYSLDFSPCKDVEGKFGHLTKLSENLKNTYESSKPKCQVERPRPEDEYTYCSVDLDLKVKSGQLIGEAGGGRPTGLDFWLTDFRQKPLLFANPQRYRKDQFYVACPLDLFGLDIKKQLYEKLGRNGDNSRTIEPRCGQIDQDIAGTAQGNWMTGEGLLDEPKNWGKTLSLVHDNANPKIGVASIGGVIGQPGRIEFEPKDEGNINREFNQVKPDGKIYCYEGKIIRPNGGQKQSERLVLQLTSETQLKIEIQTGQCGPDISFSNPTVYER